MDSALLFTRAAGQDLRLYGSQAAAVAAMESPQDVLSII